MKLAHIHIMMLMVCDDKRTYKILVTHVNTWQQFGATCKALCAKQQNTMGDTNTTSAKTLKMLLHELVPLWLRAVRCVCVVVVRTFEIWQRAISRDERPNKAKWQRHRHITIHPTRYIYSTVGLFKSNVTCFTLCGFHSKIAYQHIDLSK